MVPYLYYQSFLLLASFFLLSHSVCILLESPSKIRIMNDVLSHEEHDFVFKCNFIQSSVPYNCTVWWAFFVKKHSSKMSDSKMIFRMVSNRNLKLPTSWSRNHRQVVNFNNKLMRECLQKVGSRINALSLIGLLSVEYFNTFLFFQYS